jgi:DNA-binding CsgD family transcriptional regulator
VTVVARAPTRKLSTGLRGAASPSAAAPVGLLRRFVLSLPEAVVMVTPGGRVSLHNAAAAAHLGPPAAVGTELLALGPVGLALDSVVAEAADLPGLGERRVRLGIPRAGTYRILVLALPSGGRGLVFRREVVRDDELHARLMQELGLSSVEARLAIRVRRYPTTAAIAAALGLREAAVKMRLSRLCRRLGLSRAGLVNLVERRARGLEGAEGGRTLALPSPPPLPEAARPAPAGAVAASPADLLSLLQRLDAGVGLFDAQGQALWLSDRAATLLREVAPAAGPDPSAGGGLGDALGGAPALSSGDGAPRHVCLPRADVSCPLHLTSWSVDVGLVGIAVRSEQLRASEMARLIEARFGVTARQARIVVQLARGLSHGVIATMEGSHEGSVRMLAASSYQRLGVPGRGALAALVADLGGVSDDGD